MDNKKFAFTIIGLLAAVICLQLYNTYRLNKLSGDIKLIYSFSRFNIVSVGGRFVGPYVVDLENGEDYEYDVYIDALKARKDSILKLKE